MSEQVVRIVHEMVPTLDENHESIEVTRSQATGTYGWRIRAPSIERIRVIDQQLRSLFRTAASGKEESAR